MSLRLFLLLFCLVFITYQKSSFVRRYGDTRVLTEIRNAVVRQTWASAYLYFSKRNLARKMRASILKDPKTNKRRITARSYDFEVTQSPTSMNNYKNNDAWWVYQCKIGYDKRGKAVLGEIYLETTGPDEQPQFVLYNDDGHYVMSYNEFQAKSEAEKQQIRQGGMCFVN